MTQNGGYTGGLFDHPPKPEAEITVQCTQSTSSGERIS
jgi:hypothetical protein